MQRHPSALCQFAVCSALCGLGFGTPALAQAEKLQPADSVPALPTPAADDHVLQGPHVNTDLPKSGARLTLVHKDFEGKLEKLDIRPEFAAAQLMVLDDATRAKLKKLETARTAEVDEALKANRALFLEIQGANQAGDRSGARPLIRKFREAAPELFEPPLADRCAKEMNQTDAATFRAIVAEYMQALAQDQAGNLPRGRDAMTDGANPDRANPDRADPGRPGAAQRGELMLTIRELARSLGATVSERRERLDAQLAAIDATPEQGDKIRGIIRSSAGQSKSGDLSPAQRAETSRQIMDLLTPEQQRLWIQNRPGR